MKFILAKVMGTVTAKQTANPLARVQLTMHIMTM